MNSLEKVVDLIAVVIFFELKPDIGLRFIIFNLSSNFAGLILHFFMIYPQADLLQLIALNKIIE